MNNSSCLCTFENLIPALHTLYLYLQLTPTKRVDGCGDVEEGRVQLFQVVDRRRDEFLEIDDELVESKIDNNDYIDKFSSAYSVCRCFI